MNIPDYWIKTIKEVRDEDINVCSIFWEVKNRRPDEKTISYCESHDQALVGDKTIIFRLIDADMYWHFAKKDVNDLARRGIALHKMIRLVTAGAINGGYLNFMGNEFGRQQGFVLSLVGRLRPEDVGGNQEPEELPGYSSSGDLAR